MTSLVVTGLMHDCNNLGMIEYIAQLLCAIELGSGVNR
jgi:hypothetical protein